MEDQAIIQLFWDWDQEAVAALGQKYGRYCRALAENILKNREDAEECVSDAYLRVWNAVPPERPRVLPAFLGRIVRNLAFNRWQSRTAEKRGGGEISQVLSELSECVSGGEDAAQALDRRELLAAIQDFLDTLPEERRRMFVCRCWYCDSVKDIAARLHTSPASVSMALHRTREKLRAYLLERGFLL